MHRTTVPRQRTAGDCDLKTTDSDTDCNARCSARGDRHSIVSVGATVQPTPTTLTGGNALLPVNRQ